MKTWFTSLSGAITLSLIAFLSLVGRLLLDFRFVAPDAISGIGTLSRWTFFVLLYLGGWVWALLAAQRGGRGGLIAVLVYNLLGLLGAVGTRFVFCHTACQIAWPLYEIIIWCNLVSGLVAAIAAGLHLGARPGKTG